MILRIVASVLFLSYLGVAAYVTLNQRAMLYLPDRERVDPKSVGLNGFAEELVDTPDGVRIVTWWAPPKPGHPVMVYFHGNGGNISYRWPRAELFQREGCGVLMVEYRGFGGSTGSPSEQALLADGRLMLDRLEERGISSTRVILFGESLGTGIAVTLAAERPVAAVILDSPFTALVDVAAAHFPWLPVRLLMWDRFDSLAKISRVHARLLIIHGEADGVVPFAMGERLFAAANEPKTFLRLKGADHVTPLNDKSKAAIEKLLRELSAGH